jgi:glycosyltransferase involved in cell wall biosynthesis
MSQWLSRVSSTHDVTLLARVTTKELNQVADAGVGCANVHILKFDGRVDGPLALLRVVTSYIRLGRLANLICRRERFDLLHVEFVETGVAIAGHLPLPKVLVAHDELTKPARRRAALTVTASGRGAARAYLKIIERLQRRICQKFDRIFSLSEQDRLGFLAADPTLRVSTLPFPPGLDGQRVQDLDLTGRDLLFVGAMHRAENADAVRYFHREILPLILLNVPDARLTIVGADPPKDILALARAPEVSVTGYVPDLITQYSRATVVVSPVRIGGGIIAKNIDAMAAGRALVTTSVGNEGIGAVPDEHLLIGDDAAAFAAAVVRLLLNQTERRLMAARARAFVETRFTLDACVGGLEEAYHELVASQREGP